MGDPRNNNPFEIHSSDALEFTNEYDANKALSKMKRIRDGARKEAILATTEARIADDLCNALAELARCQGRG
jgi:hypothetical protein